jgi:hypothetical protein
MGLATLLLFHFVTGEAGRKCYVYAMATSGRMQYDYKQTNPPSPPCLFLPPGAYKTQPLPPYPFFPNHESYTRPKKLGLFHGNNMIGLKEHFAALGRKTKPPSVLLRTLYQPSGSEYGCPVGIATFPICLLYYIYFTRSPPPHIPPPHISQEFCDDSGCRGNSHRQTLRP